MIQDFKGNWGPNSKQTNIDPNSLYVTGIYNPGSYTSDTGTCYASKICGRVSGVAKQAIITSLASIGFGPQWLVTVLDKILAEVPIRRRKSPPQWLPGKTTVVITLDYDLTDKMYELKLSQQNAVKSMMLSAITAIQNLGIFVITKAGDDFMDNPYYFSSSNVPQALAVQNPLIRVGSVDLYGKITPQSRKGDVYMVGQNYVCAQASFLMYPISQQNKFIDDGSGTAGGKPPLV